MGKTNNYTALVTLLVATSISSVTYGQCGVYDDFNTWSEFGISDTPTWAVSEDGRAVLQTHNGDPSYFVSAESLINETISGFVEVTSSGDDDLIGLVFGVTSSNVSGPVSPVDGSYFLLDWKRASQAGARAGFRLAEVKGKVSKETLWSFTDPAIRVIASKHGQHLGWKPHEVYELQLTYTDSLITIKVGGVEIFRVKGTYEPGGYGFYNYSQAYVRYSDFHSNRCPLASNDSVTLVEYGAALTQVLENDTDPDHDSLQIASIIEGASHGKALVKDNSIQYIPDAHFSGSDFLTYIISDGKGGTDTATVYYQIQQVEGPHALRFVAGEAVARVPHSGQLELLPNENLSLEMWFLTGTDKSSQTLMQKGASYRLGLMNGKPFASFSGGRDSVWSEDSYADGQWHHLALVVDRDEGFKMYCDGKLEAGTSKVIQAVLGGESDLLIGSGNGESGDFEGYIDEVRIWKKALTTHEVNSRMHQRLPKDDFILRDLMAYYQLDRGVGLKFYDYSCYGHDGVLSSEEWYSVEPTNLRISGQSEVKIDSGYHYALVDENPYSRIFSPSWELSGNVHPRREEQNLQVNWNYGNPQEHIRYKAGISNWSPVKPLAEMQVSLLHHKEVKGSDFLEKQNLADASNTTHATLEMDVFPNPTEAWLNIDVQNLEEETLLSVRFRDANGRLLKEWNLALTSEGSTLELDISVFPAGIYSLHAVAGKDHLVRQVVLRK